MSGCVLKVSRAIIPLKNKETNIDFFSGVGISNRASLYGIYEIGFINVAKSPLGSGSHMPVDSGSGKGSGWSHPHGFCACNALINNMQIGKIKNFMILFFIVHYL